MSRAYHLQLAAFAAEADAKWVDNLLSHFAIPGVELAGPGVPRRLSTEAVYQVALVRALTSDLRLPVYAAVELATQLLTSDAASIELSPAIALRFDGDAFRSRVDTRIAEGVDAIVPRRRGRPPARPRRG